MIRWQMEDLRVWTDPDTDPRRSASPFKATWDKTLRLLSDEVELLGASHAVIGVVLGDRGGVRRDGMLMANTRVAHPGVVITFESEHLGPLRYATDAYESRWSGDRLSSWQANVRAVALGLEALRAVDRYGIAMRHEQYVGWRALPPGTGLGAATGMTSEAAAETMLRLAGLDGFAPDREGIRASAALIVKRARSAAHPDANGGERGQWNLLENAIDTLRRAGWLPAELTP